MPVSERKCASTGQRVASLLVGGMLLLWIVPVWAQPAADPVPLEDRGGAAAGVRSPQGEIPAAQLLDALEIPAAVPQVVPEAHLGPIERAWFAAAGSLKDRVERTLDAALEAGRPNLENLARALLLDESLGDPLQRAEAAVRLAPELLAARMALGQALWSEERDLTGALEQIRHAARTSDHHLEASLWLRASVFHVLFTACLVGGLLFLFVAGGSLLATAARLLGKLPVSFPLVSRAALVAGLLLIPAVLGEGLFGVALAFAFLGLWPGSSRQRVAVAIALLLSVAGLYPLADRAAEELVALDSDPVAESVFAVEHAQPSRIDIDRLNRADGGDPLVARALALHAKRAGDLEGAERRFGALVKQNGSLPPSLLNNAANVRLSLDRTEEAVELYEAAARKGHRVEVLFNLSQAYGRMVQLDRQDLALAEAQLIDPVAVAELTDLYGNSPNALVTDLPVPMETIRPLLRDPVAARRVATALRLRFAPGWLGQGLMNSLLGIALVVLLASGAALALRRGSGSAEAGDRQAGFAGSLTGREAADPFLRMVRLAALRERRARIDKVKFLLAVILPGAAGVVSRRPMLGLLGSMVFGLILASWWARSGWIADPLAVGAGASLLFTVAAVASAAVYLVVMAVTIALWERP